MKIRALLFFAILFYSTSSFAQNIFKAFVKDSLTNEVLIGVTAFVKGTNNGSSSDITGLITISNIPEGKQILVFTSVGYSKKEVVYTFPLSASISNLILLAPQTDLLHEVIVEGTRNNRSIANIPTRVEVLTEEIDEASTMDPSKVAHLLTHSTGIQVQQTSATSNTANVRIQGLDGRYTQILKDGFPLYGGFGGSLSIMQIPPLDLRQVEYIKGSASTLYGGGAIAGLINLISKDPSKEEILIHINKSHIGALDLNGFMSKKLTKKIGFTFLAQRNSHAAFDADKDGFTDLPWLVKYNFNPKLFFDLSERTILTVGATFTTEDRSGGDTKAIDLGRRDSIHFYEERNNIERSTSQIKLERKIDESQTITLRNSVNYFKRILFIRPSANINDEYLFRGIQLSSFSEIAYSLKHKENVLITGLNFYTDQFDETRFYSQLLRNESYQTVGGFANYTFDLGTKVSMESGFRADYVVGKKIYYLPRLSALFKWTDRLTTRIGGGLGYRNASIFNQEAEIMGYKNVLPINKLTTQAEQSTGGNVDIGYKLPIGKSFFINVNQMLFATVVNHPLVLRDTSVNSGIYQFYNANGFTQSWGAETFFKFGFYDFVFFMGYTYTNATNHFNGNISTLTLTPKHSIKGDLLYALPGKWRIGMDYEYKSGQTLSTGRVTRDYWTYGAIVEYTYKKLTLFGNVEDFTNVRQTKFESMKSAPYNTPQFTEVWAPLDGIVFNSGFKLRL